jgi:hypothetical protein
MGRGHRWRQRHPGPVGGADPGAAARSPTGGRPCSIWLAGRTTSPGGWPPGASRSWPSIIPNGSLPGPATTPRPTWRRGSTTGSRAPTTPPPCWPSVRVASTPRSAPWASWTWPASLHSSRSCPGFWPGTAASKYQPAAPGPGRQTQAAAVARAHPGAPPYGGSGTRLGRPRLGMGRDPEGLRPASDSALRRRNSIWALVLRNSSPAQRARASWTAGSSRSRMLLRSTEWSFTG